MRPERSQPRSLNAAPRPGGGSQGPGALSRARAGMGAAVDVGHRLDSCSCASDPQMGPEERLSQGGGRCCPGQDFLLVPGFPSRWGLQVSGLSFGAGEGHSGKGQPTWEQEVGCGGGGGPFSGKGPCSLDPLAHPHPRLPVHPSLDGDPRGGSGKALPDPTVTAQGMGHTWAPGPAQDTKLVLRTRGRDKPVKLGLDRGPSGSRESRCGRIVSAAGRGMLAVGLPGAWAASENGEAVLEGSPRPWHGGGSIGG